MSFADLGLSDKLTRVLTELGYDTPTAIQAEAIPAVLANHDLLASAQTGTGKTASFVLPILEKFSTQGVVLQGKMKIPPVRALILTPTRELAVQVQESVQNYSKYARVSSVAIYGGVNIRPQMNRLRRQVDILVATPGRLLDHVQQRTIDLSHIEVLVLDEADRMLDMGFIHDIRRIMALMPTTRQNLLFSATFSGSIRELADSLLNQPKVIEVAQRNTTAQNVTQKVHPVDRERKRELLTHLIETQNWQQALIFTKTKHGANRLAEQLDRDGIRSTAIHGDKSQAARMQALTKFKKGQVRILVATDVAARGIDISELPYVVNFDLPMTSEDYVHRIGRTGRAGSEGEAISLVSSDERHLLRNIERLVKRTLDQEIITGFEPIVTARAAPDNKRRPSGARPKTGTPFTHRPKRGADSSKGDSSFGDAPRTGRKASAAPNKGSPLGGKPPAKRSYGNSNPRQSRREG